MRPMRPQLAMLGAWFLCVLAVALGLGSIPLFVSVTRAAGTPWPAQTVDPPDASVLVWNALPLVLLALWALAAHGAGGDRPALLPPPGRRRVRASARA
jgi:hypothetical protein